MPTGAEQIKSSGRRFSLTGLCWREIIFWLLLLSAFAALSSPKPRQELAGLIEACGLLMVSVSSLGRLKGLGLEFIAWERIPRRAITLCISSGLLAGSVIVVV